MTKENWYLIVNNKPAARCEHDMVYDNIRQSVILFGGYSRTSARFGGLKYSKYKDTWELQDSVWTKIDVEGPGSRYGHKMVYMRNINKILLFGGHNDKKLMNDTWLWDGSLAKWTKIHTSKAPSPRYDFGMVYDPSNEIVLLFGGQTEGFKATNDLWMWNGEEWQLIEEHSPPKPRYGHGMVSVSYTHLTLPTN